MFSSPGVVIPRRLQVSQDHVMSHVTPVVQHKDSQVAVATKPCKHTDVKESVKHSSVAMDSADNGSNDDVTYDG